MRLSIISVDKNLDESMPVFLILVKIEDAYKALIQNLRASFGYFVTKNKNNLNRSELLAEVAVVVV